MPPRLTLCMTCGRYVHNIIQHTADTGDATEPHDGACVVLFARRNPGFVDVAMSAEHAARLDRAFGVQS